MRIFESYKNLHLRSSDKVSRIALSMLLVSLLVLGLTGFAQAMQFQFGTLGADDYGYSYGDINVVNTTGTQGSLLPGVDITDGELWYSLANDENGSNSTNYHLILANSNSTTSGFYDYLTWQYYASYDPNTNTYTDGEGVSAIGPGESLINLVDSWYTHTLIDSSLYIKDLNFTGKAHFDNFTFTDNGVTYTFTGDVDLSAELFKDQWYSISTNAGVEGSSVSIWGDIPEEQVSPVNPVPEPGTGLLVMAGFCAMLVSGLRRRLMD